ncbi:hypothetical protein K2173_018229 [Erythroxylum novogranatense]|uniref:Geranylgeranyl transferase type-2 subunit alpha n=1 Tax=Erythroxylum novogranatense TaxID=1862640 RepID=A0AAV8TML7_9ROSI|nr:hypothetical protein K2173_018229 [Erythroxylum novogranatense]
MHTSVPTSMQFWMSISLVIDGSHCFSRLWKFQLEAVKMHGRPRKPFKPKDETVSVDKAQKLRALQSQFLSNHHHKNYTREAVELSAEFLEINPESYTAWNYKKLTVEYNLTHFASDPDLVKSIFDKELRLSLVSSEMGSKQRAFFNTEGVAALGQVLKS